GHHRAAARRGRRRLRHPPRRLGSIVVARHQARRRHARDPRGRGVHVARAGARRVFHLTGAIDAYDRLIRAVAETPADAVLPHAAYLLAADRARVLYLDPLPEDTAASAARVASARGEKTGAKTKGASAARPLPGADFGRAPPLPPVREIVDAE